MIYIYMEIYIYNISWSLGCHVMDFHVLVGVVSPASGIYRQGDCVCTKLFSSGDISKNYN